MKSNQTVKKSAIIKNYVKKAWFWLKISLLEP